MKLPYIFERRMYTHMVIEALIPEVQKVIEKYGYATVADVYEIMDKLTFTVKPTMCQFIHFRQGWTSISDFFAKPYSEHHWGYIAYGVEVSNLRYL